MSENSLTLLGYWSDNSKIYVKYFDKDVISFDVDFNPYLFVPSRGFDGYRSIYGYALQKREFSNRYEMMEKLSSPSAVMEKWHGTTDIGLQYVSEKFRVGEGEVSHFTVMYFDIEVECQEGFPDAKRAEWPVNAISTIVDGRKFLFRYYDKEPDVGDMGVVHVKCDDERDMLEKFALLIRKKNVDVLTGWYIGGFDIPYLAGRMKHHFGDDAMNMWSIFGRSYITKRGELKVYGLNIIDLMEAYKKFEKKPRPSYRLDMIAEIELGENKHSIDGDVSGFDLWKYEEHYDDFFKYSMQDTLLLEKIDKKKGIIDLMIAIAIKTHSNVEDVMGTVKVWENFFYSKLFQSSRVPFVRVGDVNDNRKLIGAFVLEPQAGKHDWVVSFDLTSLYPSIMIGLNMSPETIVDSTFSGDVCKASNGVLFRKDKVGVVPEFLKELFADRKEYKRLMLEKKKGGDKEAADFYDLRQKAVKVLMNGLYGAMSNKWFNFYDFRIAEAITTTGRRVNEVMRKALQKFVEQGIGGDKEYVIAGDTDSAYVTLAGFVSGMNDDEAFERIKELADDTIPAFLDRVFEKMAEHDFNAIEQRFHADREAIARSAIFTGKKKYCMLVLDSEGVPAKEPGGDLKVVGLESVKGSHYGKKADVLKRAYRLCLSGASRGDLMEFIKKEREEFFNWDFDDMAISVSVSTLQTKEKGTPINVTAAVTYNDAVARKFFDGVYEPIKAGDKIRYAYLISGNPLGSHVCGWLPGNFPKGLEEWVDKPMQFEKTLLSPIQTVAEVLGWSVDADLTVGLDDI